MSRAGSPSPDSAYALFRDEYKLPLLPPGLAAQMATVAEHLFPALVLGLFTRLSAALLLHALDDSTASAHPDAAHPPVMGGADAVPGGARGAGSVSLDRALGIR